MLSSRLPRTPFRRVNPHAYITSRRNFNLDFGPQQIITLMTEHLQYVHEITHMPWWLFIPMTTVVLRSTITLPMAILQRIRIRKQAQLRPIISATNPVLKLNLARRVSKAKTEEIKAREEQSDSNVTQYTPKSPVSSMTYEQILLLSAKETRKRQKKLFKDNNVQLWKNIILPACQFPLWIAMSWTFRDLSGWTTWERLDNKPLDTSLYTEGLYWFTDLTISDTMHVFPLIIGVISLCNVEWTFKTLELTRITSNQSRRANLTTSLASVSRMSVIFLMAVSLHAPVALVLYWLSSQAFSFVQNVIMDLVMPISFTPKRRFNFRRSNPKYNSQSVIH